ncbi:MAG: hypothetical protein ACI9NT_001144 [Bacteroidia bacterium]|jgi:hypothetical protein
MTGFTASFKSAVIRSLTLTLPFVMGCEGSWQVDIDLPAAAGFVLLYFGALAVITAMQFSSTMTIVLSQFYLWSYIHITASMALSAAHPQWLVRLFQRGSAGT